MKRCSILAALLLAVFLPVPVRAAEDFDALLLGRRGEVERAMAAALIEPPPADAINAVNAGVPNDGAADAAAPLNAALRAAKGRPVYLPAGVYLLKQSLTPPSGTRLFLAANAEMRRGFDGGNGDVGGALVQGNKDFGTTDVQITGGRWTNPGNAFQGRVFNIIGKGWTIDAVRVESWGNDEASICTFIAGDQITIRRCVFVGSKRQLGQAGIRITAGQSIRVSDCYIESGDDTFCAFPPERAAQLSAGRAIRDVTFERCFGSSGKARFLACGLTAVNALRKHDITADDLNAVGISEIRFIDCAGRSLAEGKHAPAFFVICAQASERARVEAVRFERCHGVAGPNADECLKVVAAKGATVEDVRFERCKLVGGKKWTTITPNCRQVELKDCEVHETLVSERK